MKTGIIIALILIIGIGLIFINKNRKKDSISDKLNTRAKGTIFYHEDDFCQIQLLPDDNFSWLIKQAENVADFSEKHRDGYGYTDMMVREEEKRKLVEKKILVAEVDSLFDKLKTTRHTEVTTGYGQDYRILSENTIGFGQGYSAIYFDYEGEFVSNIWMTNISSFDKEKLINVFLSLGKKWNLLLMDWNSLELVDLKNKEQIEQYLN